MTDSYIYIIVALLPISSFILTIQVNPYNALVIRGILGGVAALVYAVLGAADVALTEALVGTMLAITLYVVAVRSSLVMRLGILKDYLAQAEGETVSDTGYTQPSQSLFAQLIAEFRDVARKYHLRLELVPYPDPQSLDRALLEKEIHAIFLGKGSGEEAELYQTTTRIRRLYDIFQTELSSSANHLDYLSVSDTPPLKSGEKH
ncbi:MAG: DUF4040 domain-containing protein [Desertifilum sp. SIO1I2]|nr:DUF4040 domain-containing protein [Desertifilum sp. SIO1I2]